MTTDTQGHVAAAAALRPLARDHADETEAGRRLAPPVVDAIARAGLFRMLVPREIGGLETDVSSMVRAIEELSAGDAAAGWCLMIGATTGIASARLPREGAEEIYGGEPLTVTGGMLMPRGTAVRVDGGYRVSARWSFGSGIDHCAWMLGGSTVDGPDGPELNEHGTPHMRLFYFPSEDIHIHDTWNVSGLRGTGSHDFEVLDAFVPERRSYPLPGAVPWASGTLYRFPMLAVFALGIAGVALGVARDAIAELSGLAGGKVPAGSRRPLAERAAAQTGIAEAEALRLSARAFLLGTVDEVWARVHSGEKMSVEDRAMLRLAATNAALSCSRAVDICYNLGGGSSIYAENRLQRDFRDVHTLTQHVMVGPPTLEVVGRVMLGVPTDTSML
jgi:alkylation response protein AidB-like acyl-CoA dehydrogenase